MTDIRAFRIPLRVPFRGVTERRGLLLNGPRGWGEFSPFPEYPPDVCSRWLAATQEAATSEWPPSLRNTIPVNVTVPAVDPEAAHKIVRASGCSTAKVKVGDIGDTARVEAVRDALGPHGRIRVDVNGAWEIDAAAARINELARFDLEYVEQPVASLEEMAKLRLRVDVPLAADESVRNAPDPLDIARMDAADIVVLKVQPLGGVWNALAVAERAGLPAVVSSALETSVGISGGITLAAALPDLPYACGLATVALLEGDVVADPLLPVDGAIEVRRPPVDDAALSPYEVVGPGREELVARMNGARVAG